MSSAVWARMLSGHCSLLAKFWISVIFLRTAAASVGRRSERTNSLISWIVAGSVSLSAEQANRWTMSEAGEVRVGVQTQGRVDADAQLRMLSHAQPLPFRQLPGSTPNSVSPAQLPSQGKLVSRAAETTLYPALPFFIPFLCVLVHKDGIHSCCLFQFCAVSSGVLSSLLMLCDSFCYSE